MIGWSADGKSVYVNEAKGTVGRICAVPVDGGAPREVSAGDGLFGAINLSLSRAAVAFVWHSSDRAPEAHVSPLDRWQPVQVSRANADFPKHPFGRTEVIRWTSKDGLELEGLLT